MPRLLPHHVKVTSDSRPLTSSFSLNENNGAPRARDSQGQVVYNMGSNNNTGTNNNTGSNNNTGTKVRERDRSCNYLSVLT